MEVTPDIGYASSLEKPKKMRQCPNCGQPTEIKSIWKSLFRMPTMNEWLVLFMMIMMVVASYAYKHDVGICREYIKNIDYVCASRNNSMVTSVISQTINISSLNLTFITPPPEPPHLKENISNSSNNTNG